MRAVACGTYVRMKEHHNISVSAYAWAALNEAARAENTSVSGLLERWYGPPTEQVAPVQAPRERVVEPEGALESVGF
jgi:hypothetical protein